MNHLDFSIIQLTTMREAILTILDDGRLRANGSRGPWSFYPNEISGWKVDDDASTKERTQFCDEVQSYVMKEAQKANASAF